MMRIVKKLSASGYGVMVVEVTVIGSGNGMG